MRFPHALTTSRSRSTLISLAAFAALGAFLLLGAQASAQSSGGVSAGSTGGTGTTPPSADSDEYARIWSGIPSREKRWARATSRCESGGNPDAVGGGGIYRGAFQFLKSTWKASPKSPGGDPIDYDYRTQAVVAVLLKKRDGAGHWPVCG